METVEKQQWPGGKETMTYLLLTYITTIFQYLADSIEQESASYIPIGHIQHASFFVNKVLLKHSRIYLFTYFPRLVLYYNSSTESRIETRHVICKA